ncbi:hypothetical protein MC885_018685, partial [Smutsia gigantea]
KEFTGFCSSADCCIFFLFPSNSCFFSQAVSGFFFNIFPAFLPKCIFSLGLLYPASSAVPGIGPSLQKPFQEYLEAQRQKLHHRSKLGTPQGENWLSWVFEKLVVVMVCYFVLSIINSMAQSYAKRIQQRLNSEEKTK